MSDINEERKRFKKTKHLPDCKSYRRGNKLEIEFVCEENKRSIKGYVAHLSTKCHLRRQGNSFILVCFCSNPKPQNIRGGGKKN
jgi:hypothetical protein